MRSFKPFYWLTLPLYDSYSYDENVLGRARNIRYWETSYNNDNDNILPSYYRETRETIRFSKTCQFRPRRGSNLIFTRTYLRNQGRQQVNGQGQYLVTAIFAEPRNTANIRSGISRDLRKNAQLVAENWRLKRPSETTGECAKVGSSTEQCNEKIRLDHQETQPINTRNYGRLENWQLQINGETKLPTTVAQVKIPKNLEGFDQRGYRQILKTGLETSLDRGGTACVLQAKLIPKKGIAEISCPHI